ncbi:hypothetical protein PGT21_013264 [Puccinia graminis f. sp. tritici]|uniref:Uncharacterized protein n=2 Tax=Puccinia graminis f. sp. tritici TaxID=56615 RepID=E3KU86_PUCGT|nr:uncharacterized protein PGTG_14576 [Puccinia graminis f. sp. tritici CRL 75-36-700-3]EFP87861.2 hypothetical protein PGTG_14576 [Puccinia graminis f. sp. tritici CRL 75-36-700-3]KAA1065855.1 hypothetical protein PGT21_013264 [Puccinia graminis f. sp. tritici]KAA1104947.1 hypothetical protein PGTUg99_007025 [Puccinia graminis f. sp. tritici]
MASSQRLMKIQSELKQIQRTWPLDPLRINQPELQISSSISKAIERVFSNNYKNDQSVSSQELLEQKTLEGAEKMLSSLENLSNGSIARQYPFPKSMRNPASFPGHYEELNEGVQRAIRGESLPWYRRWIRFT